MRSAIRAVALLTACVYAGGACGSDDDVASKDVFDAADAADARIGWTGGAGNDAASRTDAGGGTAASGSLDAAQSTGGDNAIDSATPDTGAAALDAGDIDGGPDAQGVLDASLAAGGVDGSVPSPDASQGADADAGGLGGTGGADAGGGAGAGGAITCLPPVICASSRACNGTFYCPTYDPCRPSTCNFGQCDPGLPLPDGTPCDDGNSCSHEYPASAGCPSNECIGGANEGLACTRDADCPGGSCFMNRCFDGPNADEPCSTNDDCRTGEPLADCVKAPEGAACNGGSEAGRHCRLVCVGGLLDGWPCTSDGDCFDGVAGTCPDVLQSTDCPPTGRCVRWTADATTGTCKARSDNPHCDTVADCPTTKYCAADPKNDGGGPDSCYYEDSCCAGGSYAGPCLVWDACDLVEHVCVRTTQGGVTTLCDGGTRLKYGESPCVGTSFGVSNPALGGVCNNVCLGGVCSSASNACP